MNTIIAVGKHLCELNSLFPFDLAKIDVREQSIHRRGWTQQALADMSWNTLGARVLQASQPAQAFGKPLKAACATTLATISKLSGRVQVFF